MNSSGIKRGLAASAVSALAVAGLPLLASSAHAAVGDNFTVAYTGPALNGGDPGAVVVIRAQDGEIDPAALELTSTTGTDKDSQNNGDQTVEITSVSGPVNDSANSDYEFITLRIKTTTANNGDTAAFRLFEDDAPANDKLDAGEARANVSIATAGPVASIDVSPTNQSAAQGIASGAYTVTVKDSAGRTTQLADGDSINIDDEAPAEVTETGPNTAAAGDDNITSEEIARGTDTFTAKSPDTGTYSIVLSDDADSAIDTTATLTVTQAADLSDDEIDIVTGADSWDGFGNANDRDGDSSLTLVRVDQSTIRIDIDSNDPNSTVTLNLDGSGVTFGGKDKATVSTVLDSNGVGSLTITPDAGTIQDGDSIDVSGSFAQTLEFDRAEPTKVESADRYFSAVKGSVDVTASVVDQFGQPVTTGFVEAYRTGPNAASDTTPQRKAVGSDGKVTFTFTDTKATNGQVETVKFDYYPDQFANDWTIEGSTEIKYTTDGQGSNFKTSLDGKNTEAADYDATDVNVVPLADTVADNDGVPASNESADLDVDNVESGSDMTVSVDNGALILEPGETKLSQGSASVTDAANNFATSSGYRIIGTKAGVVTVTVTSANRTETSQFTVAAETDKSTARNVTVSGPAQVEHGTTQISYTAVITDAFGNPVAGVPVSDLNIQVTGPAQFQDSGAVTDANGQISLNVRVDADAEGDVTIRVQGFGEQFGAGADQLTSSSPANSGKGLPASSNVATATTTVAAAPAQPTVIHPNITGKHINATDTVAGYDRIVVSAKAAGADAVVKLYRVKNGVAKRVKSKDLGADGKAIFKRADLNGDKNTYYYATVSATATNTRGTTDTIGIR